MDARPLRTDSIVSKGLGRVEIEDPQEISSLKRDYLVVLVLQTDILSSRSAPFNIKYLSRFAPAELLMELLHRLVKSVQILVSKQIIINQIVLSSSIVEAR